MSARKRPAETDVAGELAQIGAKLDQLKDIGLDEKLHEKWIRAETGRLPRLATFDHASLRALVKLSPPKGSGEGPSHTQNAVPNVQTRHRSRPLETRK